MMRLWPFLTLALLGACGAGPLGDPHPLTKATFRGGWIIGADDTALALSSWPARGRTRAVILGLHGYGDFAQGTFEAAARHWASHGITTYAYDQRGFGANASRLAWPGPDILISDLGAVTAEIRRRHPGARLVVLGHSMGGGTVLAAAARDLDADAIVLAAPAITGGRETGLPARAAAWAVASIIPDRRFTGEGVVTIIPTDNRAALLRVARDPRSHAEPSARELLGLIRVMDRAAAAAPAVTLPTLTLVGAKDQVLAPDAIARVHGRIAGPKHLITYPDGWHWLLRDLQAERVWRDVANFALAPSHGATPTLR